MKKTKTKKQDTARPLDWLKSSRTMLFEGWLPPLTGELEFDAQRLVEVMKAVNANVVRFPANSFGAFFPSRHFTATPGLGGRDLLAEVASAVHEEGMRLVVYFGLATPVGEATAKEHPDWLQIDEQGQNRSQRFYRDDEGAWLWYDVCSHREAYRTAMRSFVSEIPQRYDVDGVYFDGPYYWTHCYCPDCQDSYRARVGQAYPDLPGHRGDYPKKPPSPKLDMTDPVIQRYMQWHFQLEQELIEDLIGDVRQRNPETAVLFHSGGIYKFDYVKPSTHLGLADGILAEQGMNFQSRYTTAVLGQAVGKPMWAYTGSFSMNPRVWGHGIEYQSEGFSSFAAGVLPAVASANQLHYDLSGKDHIRAVFDFQEQHAELLDSLDVLSWVTVPYTDANGKWYNGWYLRSPYNVGHQSAVALLLDSQIPVTALLNEQLSCPTTLQQHRAIFLADLAAMSDEEAEALREYVREGGNVIATGQTSALDAMGHPRKEPALRDLLGCSLKATGKRVADTYVALEGDHPILSGITPGALLPCVGHVCVEADEGVEVLGHVQYGRTPTTPAVVVNHYGRGKVIYLPAMLERSYAIPPGAKGVEGYLYDRNPMIRHLCRNMIRWLTGELPLVVEDESGFWVVATKSRDNNRMLVHFLNMVTVNYDKAHAMRSRVFPRPGPAVNMICPRAPDSVRALRSGENLPFTYREGRVQFQPGPIGDYEAVLIEHQGATQE